MEKHWESCITAQGVLEGVAFHLLLAGKPISDFKGLATAIAVRMVLQKVVDQKKNSLSEHGQTMKVSVAAGMALGTNTTAN
jgi:thioredoxin-like negative regulator of GroEL